MNKIKFYRINAEMTQKELAEKVNVTEGSVSLWESGTVIPRMDKLFAMKKVFNLKSIDELIGEK